MICRVSWMSVALLAVLLMCHALVPVQAGGGYNKKHVKKPDRYYPKTHYPKPHYQKPHYQKPHYQKPQYQKPHYPQHHGGSHAYCSKGSLHKHCYGYNGGYTCDKHAWYKYCTTSGGHRCCW